MVLVVQFQLFTKLKLMFSLTKQIIAHCLDAKLLERKIKKLAIIKVAAILNGWIDLSHIIYNLDLNSICFNL